jgi:hypothetical protein
MSQSNDFSKQFFADFIAARIRAREIEKRESPPAGPDRDARPVTSYGTEKTLAQASDETTSA